MQVWNYVGMQTLMPEGRSEASSSSPSISITPSISLTMVRMRSPSVEDTVHPFADGSFTTDVEIEKMIGPVERTDLIGAAVKGIGGYLRLVHRAEDFFLHAPAP